MTAREVPEVAEKLSGPLGSKAIGQGLKVILTGKYKWHSS